MSAPEASAGAALHCAIHRGTITYLRCAQCGTPICPRCLVMTPVGAKCGSCARVRLQPGFVLTPVDVALTVVVSIVGGLALGILGSALVRLIPLFAILFPMAVGFALSSAINVLVGRKRGTILKVVAAVGVVVSFLVVGLGDFVLLGPLDFVQSGMLWPLLRNELIGVVINPFNALFLILGIWVAVYRVN